MSAIQIPAALAAEIAAHPERFKPDVQVGQQVVVLSRFGGYELTGLHVGAVLDTFDGTSGRGATVADGPGRADGHQHIQSALAWALVGSIDDPGTPEPDPAGRVLVLDHHSHFSWVIGQTGHICDRWGAPERWLDVLIDGADGGRARVGRWAILPPSLDVNTAVPAAPRWQVGDGHGRTLYLNDHPIGMVDTAELAALIVESMNGPGQEIDRLNTLLAERGVTPEMPDTPANLIQEHPERASVIELADVLVAEFGGHQPSETSVHAAIRLLRRQADDLASVRDQLAEEKEWQNRLTQWIPEDFGGDHGGEGSQDGIIENWLTHQANLVQQFARLVGMFDQVVHDEESLDPVATATISIEALDQLTELVDHVDTGEATTTPAPVEHDQWHPTEPGVRNGADFDALVNPVVASDG